MDPEGTRLPMYCLPDELNSHLMKTVGDMIDRYTHNILKNF